MHTDVFHNDSNPEGWRWRGSRAPRAVMGGALVAGLLASGIGGMSGGTAGATTLSSFGAKLQAEFSTWNTTRSIARAGVQRVIGSDKAITAGATGKGVDVALVDTGIAPVPGLDTAAQVVNGPDLSLDYQEGIAPGLDAYGHGTHMASIIGGTGGMAPGARLLNMKVGAANGAVDVSQIIAAIDWTTQHRADPGFNVRVLSLSLGTDSVQSYQIDPLAHAVESAWKHGIVVVVAAGNSGTTLTNPAIDPYVLTVGADDTNAPLDATDDQVAAFSSVGTAARRVDLVAPGVSILGLRDPGSYIDVNNPSAVVATSYFKGSGTSQAAAVVSGAVAQLLSARPTLTPDQVKAVLKATAHPIALSPATSQGAGLIDVNAALTAAVPANATQTFALSSGLGSLEAARGTSHLVSDSGVVLQGEVDLQGAPWVPSVWAPASTAATAWTGGSWNGSVWTGTALAPDGTYTAFLGHTWRDATWSGHTWRAADWLGSTWAGHTWRSGAWS